MQSIHIRTRTGSISDIHIQHCDCAQCDGLGALLDQFTYTTSECPACEGMGYLEPASQEAYEAYLSDLYKDVVRKMPGRYNTAQVYTGHQPLLHTAA